MFEDCIVHYHLRHYKVLYTLVSIGILEVLFTGPKDSKEIAETGKVWQITSATCIFSCCGRSV